MFSKTPKDPARADGWSVRRMIAGAVILISVYMLAQAAVKLSDLWMLIFGSVVVAVILRAVADPLVDRLRFRDGLAVLTAVLAVLALLSAIGFLFGSQIAQQVDQLSQTLPAAWERTQAQLAVSPTAAWIVSKLENMGGEAGRALALAPRFALGALSGVTTLVLVVVAGIFLATQPVEAREGALSMFPIPWRPRLREVMNACGRALKGWLKAQLVSMILIGTLVTIGLAVIGVPAPLALGLFAGLAQFVPIVGPIASAVPALIMAATDGGHTALLTLILYIGVSQLEANLITPLVQKNVASLPVVLGIFAVVGLGTLFGFLGVLFAVPVTLVLYTTITMLYRRDVLGDAAAAVPGEEVG